VRKLTEAERDAAELLEVRIGADRVEGRINLDVRQLAITLAEGLLQPSQGLIFFLQSGVDLCDVVRRDVALFGNFF
jgi:hypothetical protein